MPCHLATEVASGSYLGQGCGCGDRSYSHGASGIKAGFSGGQAVVPQVILSVPNTTTCSRAKTRSVGKVVRATMQMQPTFLDGLTTNCMINNRRHQVVTPSQMEGRCLVTSTTVRILHSAMSINPSKITRTTMHVPQALIILVACHRFLLYHNRCHLPHLALP